MPEVGRHGGHRMGYSMQIFLSHLCHTEPGDVCKLMYHEIVNQEPA